MRFSLSIFLAVCITLVGASTSRAEYAFTDSADLKDSWRKEFGVGIGLFETGFYPTGQETKGIIVSTRLVTQFNTRVDIPSDPEEQKRVFREDLKEGKTTTIGGRDIIEWQSAPPLELTYIELVDTPVTRLFDFPEDTLNQITHVSLRTTWAMDKVHPRAKDLELLRKCLPSLSGLGIDCRFLEDINVNARRAFMLELFRFTGLRELRLCGIGASTAHMYGVQLRNWLGTLTELTRLDLWTSHVGFWDAKLAISLDKLEWLNLSGCIGLPQETFWSTLGVMSNLRCLGLGSDFGATAVSWNNQAVARGTGWNSDRLGLLASLPRLEALCLDGGRLFDESACAAIAGLQGLRYFGVPLSARLDTKEITQLMNLTSLRSLHLPRLTKDVLPWVQAQTDLIELRTSIEGGNDEGVVAGLSACRNLRALLLTRWNANPQALEGLKTLPITNLKLSHGSVAIPGGASLARLISACPELETLILDVPPAETDRDENGLQRPLSREVWRAVAGCKRLQVLAVRLPEPETLGTTLESLSELRVLVDFDGHRTPALAEAIGKGRRLSVVRLIGLPDDMAAAIKKARPGIRILRD